MKCPLCFDEKAVHFFEDKFRPYYRCQTCALIFVPKKFWPSVQEEKKVYDRHENSPSDLRYRNFLNRLFAPMDERLDRKSFGLDFGSGSGPTLSVMFEEAGHTVDLYDEYYAKNPDVFFKKYDFIVSSEVFEHLFDPAFELERLLGIIKPGGWLGIMTKLAKDRQAFSNWHYIRDLTHVCFYSRATFEWIANKWTLKYVIIGDDVIIFSSGNTR